jgi:hypothetical protein
MNDRLKRRKFIKKLIRVEAKDPKMKATQTKEPAIQAAHSLWEEDKRERADEADNSSDDDDSSTATVGQGG